MAEGKFRQDLYYRINVMRIDSPPLQDRPEDIPLIARHFLHQYASVFQKPMDAIEPEALDILQSYAWPGNVRELENVMQRAIILAPGRIPAGRGGGRGDRRVARAGERRGGWLLKSGGEQRRERNEASGNTAGATSLRALQRRHVDPGAAIGRSR